VFFRTRIYWEETSQRLIDTRLKIYLGTSLTVGFSLKILALRFVNQTIQVGLQPFVDVWLFSFCHEYFTESGKTVP